MSNNFTGNNNKKISTIADFVFYAENKMNLNSLYFGHGTDNAYDEAVAMVEFVLNKRNMSYDDKDKKLTKPNLTKLLNLVNQRIETQKPLAYLTNQAFFAELDFFINQKVIVPRSPIAELILDGFSFIKKPIYRALDLCTGSGCIGLSMAYYGSFEVVLSDISDEALNLSKINLNHLEKKTKTLNKKINCGIVKSDLFDSIEGKFDLIVSNPPYVNENEYQNLDKSYFYEPKIALVAQDKGLEFIKIILEKAQNYLNDGGYLILEVGNSEDELIKYYPLANFIWLEFENGGSSVLAINKEDLIQINKTKFI